MPAIHLIKRHGEGLPDIKPVTGEKDTFTSGFWTVAEGTAQKLLFGKIYFHQHQRDPSDFGGTIITFEKICEGDYAGKVVFKFVASRDCRNVKTEKEGWSQEMKIVM